MKHRRVTVLVILMGVLVGAPAVAGDRSREARYDFDPSKPGGSGWFGSEYGLVFGDAVTFEIPEGARLVDLSVVDDRAADVAAAVWQEGAEARVFCNRSGLLPVRPGAPLNVQVIVDVTPGSAGCATPALPTQGTVTAKFPTIRHRHHH